MPQKNTQYLKYGALGYPLVALIWFPLDASYSHLATLFLVASFYFGLYWKESKWIVPLITSGVLSNIGLFFVWQSMDRPSLEFFGVPLGLSLLLITTLQKKQLKPGQQQWLHYASYLLIYGTSSLQVFHAQKPLFALVLGGLCLIGILVGQLLRWGALVVFAAIILVFDVVLYIYHYGLVSEFNAPIILFAAGISVFGFAVMLQKLGTFKIREML